DCLVNNSLCFRDMADSEVYHGAIKETEHLVAAPAARSVTILRHPGSFLSGGMPELIVPFAQYSGIGGIQQIQTLPEIDSCAQNRGFFDLRSRKFRLFDG